MNRQVFQAAGQDNAQTVRCGNDHHLGAGFMIAKHSNFPAPGRKRWPWALPKIGAAIVTRSSG